MTRRAYSAFLVASLLLGIPAAAHAAWPHDPFTNVQLAPASADQYVNAIVSDGVGGAIVAWSDLRSGNYDIYVQRITATGAIAPGGRGAASWCATPRAIRRSR